MVGHPYVEREYHVSTRSTAPPAKPDAIPVSFFPNPWQRAAFTSHSTSPSLASPNNARPLVNARSPRHSSKMPRNPVGSNLHRKSVSRTVRVSLLHQHCRMWGATRPLQWGVDFRVWSI
jgi:hypothetical protein